MKAVSYRDEDLDLGGEEIFESYIKVASAMTVVQLLNKAHCLWGAAAGLAGDSCNQISVTHF